jgi:hypothetical protein
MSEGEKLHVASRIYFGIHHPIQYNNKVKEIGYVPPSQVPTLIGNWKEEDNREFRQDMEVTANAGAPEELQDSTCDDNYEQTADIYGKKRKKFAELTDSNGHEDDDVNDDETEDVHGKGKDRITELIGSRSRKIL